jgi:hypothetical protein
MLWTGPIRWNTKLYLMLGVIQMRELHSFAMGK